MLNGPGLSWYEVIDWVCIALVCLLLLARTWPFVERRSPAARWTARLWGRPWSRQVFWILLGTGLLFIVAVDVIERGPAELLPHADLVVRDVARRAASHPMIRRTASTLTDLTGPGLVTATLGSVLCLFVLGHRRQAWVVLLGTTGAWMFSGWLKLVFAVPRPRPVAGLGFPSGHVLVTLVAGGLLAWALTPHVSPGTRRALYGGAGGMAILAGAARMIMDAHWLSDVVAGLASGALWLNLVILLVSRDTLPTSGSRGVGDFAMNAEMPSRGSPDG